jgi:hypothetical protein
MTRALAIAFIAVASRALAWESVCFDSTGKACSPSSGPETARQRWIGPLDEHRQLFETTAQKAGLPSELTAEHAITVFTASQTSLAPVPFDQATSAPVRQFTPGELAQLPDFSFALWDWASGNEQCPLNDGTDAVLCHDFASHMGPVNSSHFLPQAAQAYARYHALALGRAAECKAMAAALAPAAGRFDEYVKACEVEAITLEAVGQHFMQDAWSMGHMWQRWGSSNLMDFPGATVDDKRDHAVLVALASGFIHGARGVLQALPGWTTLDVDDAMCAPWDDVKFVSTDDAPTNAIGDDYLTVLGADQSQRLFNCTTSGVLAVYNATAMVHGPAAPVAGLATVDPTGPVCFSQRATNAAIVRGMGIQLKVLDVQATVPIDARFSSWLIPQVARATGRVPVPAQLKNQFRLSLMQVTTMARLTAKDDPSGTSLADGGLGDLVGVHPNGQYATPADYVDPPVPWVPSGSDREAALTRMFHRAHADQWCSTLDGSALAALQAHAADATLDASSRAAACEACAELVARQLRIGDGGTWDTSQEPLCTYLAPAPAYVYVAAGAPDAGGLAQKWCCP